MRGLLSAWVIGGLLVLVGCAGSTAGDDDVAGPGAFVALDVPQLGGADTSWSDDPADTATSEGPDVPGTSGADTLADTGETSPPDAAIADTAVDVTVPGDAGPGVDALADALVDAVADAGIDAGELLDGALPGDVVGPVDAADALADAGAPDAGAPDAGMPDVATADVGLLDASTADAGLVDVSAPEDTSTGADAEPDVTIPLAQVRLNEINCTGADWIELATDGAVDLSGWTLTDTPGDPAKSWVLPPLTLLAPGQLLVVEKGEGVEGFPFGIKCGDDTVWLLRPDGTPADSVDVSSLAAGATWGRVPDHGGPWIQTKSTPGAPNEPFEDLLDQVYDPLSVATIDLWIDEAGLAALWQDPYTYVDGKVRIALVDGYTSPVMDVGLRLKGRIGSFRNLNSKSAFKVKFNHAVKGTTFLGLKKMTLNNMVQDPSMIHETAAYTLLRALGLPASRTGYAWVRLNNRDYGLYLNLETYDDVFIAKHFTSLQHLYEGGYGLDVKPGAAPQYDVDEGDEGDRTDLELLIAAANTPPGDLWLAAVSHVTDLDEMVRLWAAEIWIGHWDGYAPTINNYYLHSDDEGRFSMMTSGADQTFGSHLAWHNGNALLFKGCMQTPGCLDAFDLAMAQILPVVGSLGLPAQIKQVAEVIAPYVAADPRRPYSVASQQSAVDATIAFIAKRISDGTMAFGCLLGGDPDPDGDGYTCSEDCNNDDPGINPGVADACGDGIDQDCSGIADDAIECPDWTEVWWGSARYLITATPRTWANARAHCQAAGADLLVLDSAAEQAWLWANAPGVAGHDWWLGLTDLAVEGTFEWVDGSVPGYTAFAGGEPNDWGGNEDCTELWSNGTWNDLNCESTLRAICEDACTPGTDADGDGYDACAEDCDDGDASVHPGALDVCLDGVDQDCSGMMDDGPGCFAGCVGLPDVGFGAALCVGGLAWADARAACIAMGGDLAVFATKAEQDAVVAAMIDVAPGIADAWIGLGDQATEGAYLWVDGTKPTWTTWAPNEPNNSGDQDCVRLYPSGLWNDSPCADAHPRICRWEEGAPATPAGAAAAPLAGPLCEPQCAGKSCGDDGCGGSCGGCSDGLQCDGTACVPPKPTCDGACGGQAAAGCYCDGACVDYGDCCPDYLDLCPPVVVPSDSCDGYCGGQAPAGCYCDAACVNYGDCCGDYKDMCVGAADTCSGVCGGMSPGGCYCDPLCGMFHDCCADKGALCGGCHCNGAVCGDDGCGGSCGVCAAGDVCDGGTCVPAGASAGCMAVASAGCDGCPCEACVCETDVFCCYVAWDGACADRCETQCTANGCWAP